MDKDTLPVMEINIGSRTDDVFTLGPLECYGPSGDLGTYWYRLLFCVKI